jgi:hypothetical protein
VSIPLWVLGPSLLVRAKRAVEIGNGSNGPKADMENCPAVVTRVGTSSKAQPRPRVSSADAISAISTRPAQFRSAGLALTAFTVSQPRQHRVSLEGINNAAEVTGLLVGNPSQHMHYS